MTYTRNSPIQGVGTVSAEAIQAWFTERGQNPELLLRIAPLKARFGDPEVGLGRWQAVTRLFETTASKVWLMAVTSAAAGGIAVALERLF